jgi:6-phosphofructokinase 1
VLTAHDLGLEIYGIREGYEGLIEPEKFDDGGVIRLTPESVRGIAHLGGTILGTVNKNNPYNRITVGPDGEQRREDLSDKVIKSFTEQGFDALVAVGGDGSMSIAHKLSQKGLTVIGVPKTIDNDLEGTSVTFGFNSAVSFATEAIDRLHSTAEAHRRVMTVEVMGRDAGWIALYSGLAGRADVILMPEIPFDLEKVAAFINSGKSKYYIIVAAEGAMQKGGQALMQGQGDSPRLGGIGEYLANRLGELTGRNSRYVMLGHLLRGGSPSATDRLLGLEFGSAAVRGLVEGRKNVLVGIYPPRIEFTPLEQVVAKIKTVPLSGEAMLTARALGICFGD